MKQLSEEEKEELENTIDRAKEVIAELDKKLIHVSVTTKSAKVVEAVGKIFNLLPDQDGKITITYEMYSKVIEKMNQAGMYKSEEFVG